MTNTVEPAAGHVQGFDLHGAIVLSSQSGKSVTPPYALGGIPK
jgi:hypothetical protein